MRILLLCLGVCLAACTSNGAATLRVKNNSDFAIVDIRVAAVNDPSFGPNLLSGSVLNPGEELTLGVDCGTYDARVIDESGAECDLHDLDLCANDAVWVLTNDSCPVFSAAKAAAH